MEIKIGDKVTPIGQTKDNLSFGYVREVTGEDVYIYWPEIRSHGTWPSWALKVKTSNRRQAR